MNLEQEDEMEYVDNKSFVDGGIVAKNQQLLRKNKEKLENIDTRIRTLNAQPPQFTFHETEVTYETFKINDTVELIHQQLDAVESESEAQKNVKLLTLYDQLSEVERHLDDLEEIPYS